MVDICRDEFRSIVDHTINGKLSGGESRVNETGQQFEIGINPEGIYIDRPERQRLSMYAPFGLAFILI